VDVEEEEEVWVEGIRGRAGEGIQVSRLIKSSGGGVPATFHVAVTILKGVCSTKAAVAPRAVVVVVAHESSVAEAG